MFKVMAGERGLVPLMFAIDHFDLKHYILADLIERGLVGVTLSEMLERDFGSNVALAARSFNDRVRLKMFAAM